MEPELTVTLGGLLIVVGGAWRLSREITTVQVNLLNLTERFDRLERMLNAHFGKTGDE
ncbi:MAG TPA: hypothetical protein VM054_07410 [bacterium]|nr:hypothetical protein [bacterium]